MNRKNKNDNRLRTLKGLGVAAITIAAGLASMPADAGFKHAGWAGDGFATSEIPAAGQPMTPGQTMYLDAVKAANPALTDAQARAKASAIHQGLCKAIDLATKQNATIGACLSKLKKNGSICVSFNMKDAVGGAVNDGKAECTANDKINISSKKLVEGCPPPYDPALYWVATILLHEGAHATQDYSADVFGLDDAKARAKKTKTRLCNEAGSGVGEPKGAHVLENEWIAEIKEALTELESLFPQSQLDWSAATTDMFNQIFPLPEPQRQDAIDALRKAACANKRGNDRAIDCYTKAKMKLQNFLDTNYVTPQEKADSLKILRDCLNTAKWKWIFKFFDIPAKAILSSAETGIIEQFEDDSHADDLDTGLLGVSDMHLLEDFLPGEFAPFLDVLMVVGPTGPGQGELQAYVDENDNGVFEPTEFVGALPMPPGFSGNMDLILPPDPVFPMLLFNHDTFEFLELQDLNFDGLPDQINPFPIFQIQQPQNIELAHMIQEWNWEGQLLVGYDDMITGALANTFEDQVLVLEDQNFDGLPDFEIPFADILPLVQFGPAWGGNPQAGDPQMEMFGYPGHQIEIQVVDPNYVPIEIIALELASVEPIQVVLSRPLAPNDWIILTDLDNGLPSPLLVIPCPGDINGDGVTDTADLGILIADFGNAGVSPADLNGDLVVDTADLGILIASFGCPN